MLIGPVRTQSDSLRSISIHLMLMLISQKQYEKFMDLYFNTSHVNVNQRRNKAGNTDFTISIHLMLMLIKVLLLLRIEECLISIHLMLMLINSIGFLKNLTCVISIHLMLMLIFCTFSITPSYASFQYISC